MTQFSFFDRPQAITVAPVVREARRSGRRVGSTGPKMLAYRDALIAHGPATDAEIAQVLGWGVSSCCGRRGDWNATVDPSAPLVAPTGRVKVGRASQCRWVWTGPR